MSNVTNVVLLKPAKNPLVNKIENIYIDTQLFISFQKLYLFSDQFHFPNFSGWK